MEDDGFTLVTGKKSARKNQKFKKTENGTHIRVDGTEKEIEKSMEMAKNGIKKSGLGSWLISQLELIAENRKIRKIILIGNGHFDGPNQPGAHQLALFLEISEFFKIPIIFQEPILTTAEKSWLENLENIEIRKEQDAKIEISSNTDDVEILAMIHGEHEILNEFLEFNWRKIDNLILIGNNYGEVNWQLSKLAKENPRIDEFFEKSKISIFPEVYEPFFNAFSSTVIMSPIFNK